MHSASRYRHFHPSKRTLECLTQAQQDVIENGRETHASGFDYYAPWVPKGTVDDLDAPLPSLDRRFVIKMKE